MKMVLISGLFGIIVGVGAYYILMSLGMDTASVMSVSYTHLTLPTNREV